MPPKSPQSSLPSDEDSAQRGAEERWTEALESYREETGQDLLKHPFAQQLLSPSSSDEVMTLLQGFTDFRAKGHKFLRVLKPVVNVMVKFLDAAAEGASNVIPGGKAIFVAIGILLQLTRGVSQLYDTIEAIFQQVRDYVERIGIHMKPSMTPIPAVMRILVETLVQVLKILAIVTKYCGRAAERGSWLRKTKDVVSLRIEDYFRVMIGKTDVAEALKKLEALAKAELQATVVHTNALVREGQPKLEAIYDSTVINDIRSWLRPPNPYPNNYGRKRVAGSCSWFFNDYFEDWREQRNGLYWVYGKAGAGKSVLCSSVIDNLGKDRTLNLVHFYFDYSDPEKQDCCALVSSVLFQIGTRSGECLEYLKDNRSHYRPTYEGLLSIFSELLRRSGRAFLVIDALDECPEPERDIGLLGFIEHLRNLQQQDDIDLRVFVVSRPEPDIWGLMPRFTTHSLDFQASMQHRDDIKSYISCQLSCPESRSYLGWSDDLKTTVEDVLIERSNGMFLWVVLQLRDLRRCAPGDVRRALDELPSDLNGTYERILKNFPCQPAITARAGQVFECIAFAKEDLSLESVLEILLVNLDDPAMPLFDPDSRTRIQNPELFILEKCPGLLDIVYEKELGCGEEVQFIHFSAQEYLMSAQLKNHSDFALRAYAFDQDAAQLTLARFCLSCLVSDSPPPNLRDYADNYWSEHVAYNACAEADDALFKLLRSFLQMNSPAFFHWATRLARWSGHYDSDTAFHWASKWGFVRCVSAMLDDSRHNSSTTAEPLVNARGARGKTALHNAAESGSVEVCRILLDNGALVDAIDDSGMTPLHTAAKYGRSDVVRSRLERCDASVEVCRILLDNGALVDAIDDSGMTPLHTAAKDGKSDVVRLLLEHCDAVGKDLCQARAFDGRTALHKAIRYRGNAEVVDLLFSRVGLSDNTNAEGHTPIYSALMRGEVDIFRVIMKHRAKLDITQVILLEQAIEICESNAGDENKDLRYDLFLKCWMQSREW